VKPSNKVERVARLQWVPLAQIDFNELAQRNLKQARVDELATEFDPEQVGYPTVNHRAGRYYVVDGHHRVEAMKIWLGEDWERQQIQCQTYEDLTEEEEAEIFLKLNNVLSVTAFDKFRIGVKAGRPEETEVERIVRECVLRVSQDQGDGAIGAVGTLMRVYRRGGPQNLARTLLIVRDAFGDAGLEASVIDGIGLLCHRYNGELDDARLVERLSKAHGGVNGLLGKAENLRKSTGNMRAHCVAAAAVEINNGGRGGRKLPSWWKADD
jgi:uncharacterized protein DUF6551